MCLTEQRMAGLQIALQLLLAAALFSVAVEAAVDADLVTHLPGYVHPDGTPKALPTRHCELLIRSQTSAFDFAIAACMFRMFAPPECHPPQRSDEIGVLERLTPAAVLGTPVACRTRNGCRVWVCRSSGTVQSHCRAAVPVR